MISSFLTFDICPTSKLEEVKKAMKIKGYSDSWVYDSKKYVFPHNSMWKRENTLIQAMDDLKQVTNSLSAEITHCIITAVMPWEGKPST